MAASGTNPNTTTNNNGPTTDNQVPNKSHTANMIDLCCIPGTELDLPLPNKLPVNECYEASDIAHDELDPPPWRKEPAGKMLDCDNDSKRSRNLG